MCPPQVREQSECVRHEDLVENTTSWLHEFQARFDLRTRPGFPIEARAASCGTRACYAARAPHAVTCCTSKTAIFVSRRGSPACSEVSSRTQNNTLCFGLACLKRSTPRAVSGTVGKLGIEHAVLWRVQVFEYKGVKHAVKFKPYSEFNTLRFGDGNSSYYTAELLRDFAARLDLPLEADLGYFYDDIFQRWLPKGFDPVALGLGSGPGQPAQPGRPGMPGTGSGRGSWWPLRTSGTLAESADTGELLRGGAGAGAGDERSADARISGGGGKMARAALLNDDELSLPVWLRGGGAGSNQGLGDSIQEKSGDVAGQMAQRSPVDEREVEWVDGAAGGGTGGNDWALAGGAARAAAVRVGIAERQLAERDATALASDARTLMSASSLRSKADSGARGGSAAASVLSARAADPSARSIVVVTVSPESRAASADEGPDLAEGSAAGRGVSAGGASAEAAPARDAKPEPRPGLGRDTSIAVSVSARGQEARRAGGDVEPKPKPIPGDRARGGRLLRPALILGAKLALEGGASGEPNQNPNRGPRSMAPRLSKKTGLVSTADAQAAAARNTGAESAVRAGQQLTGAENARDSGGPEQGGAADERRGPRSDLVDPEPRPWWEDGDGGQDMMGDAAGADQQGLWGGSDPSQERTPGSVRRNADHGGSGADSDARRPYPIQAGSTRGGGHGADPQGLSSASSARRARARGRGRAAAVSARPGAVADALHDADVDAEADAAELDELGGNADEEEDGWDPRETAEGINTQRARRSASSAGKGAREGPSVRSASRAAGQGSSAGSGMLGAGKWAPAGRVSFSGGSAMAASNGAVGSAIMGAGRRSATSRGSASNGAGGGGRDAAGRLRLEP